MIDGWLALFLMEPELMRQKFFTQRSIARLSIIPASIALIFTWLLMIWMPSTSFTGVPPAFTPAQESLKIALTQDIQTLQSIGPRNDQNPGALQKTIAFLAPTFPLSQPYSIQQKTYENRIAEIKGTEHPEQIILIGAHYDTVTGSPGADDNGTGIAAITELTKRFAQRKPARTLRFVAFTNEEQPFAGTETMGSRVYAKQTHDRNENILAMFSLEMLGYYSDREKSQNYPVPVNGLYPDRGNFIGFISNLKSRELLKTSLLVFRQTAKVPSEGIALPEAIRAIGRSDHASFWTYNYPALMITDTANFRTPHYHTPNDTLDTLDLDRFTRVVLGLEQVIAGLGGVT
jgi:Peptidase family M28